MAESMEVAQIVDYDPEWPKRFARLRQQLSAKLGDKATRIDHIGSTAVEGLAAKDIIDILISVPSLEPMEPYRTPLEQQGYVLKQAHGKRGRDESKRYFREPEGMPEVHIHVVRDGSWAQVSQLLLRDYMRADERDRDLYERTKRHLAKVYETNRDAYNEGKYPVIWQILNRAHWWSQEVGWWVGYSDAPEAGQR